MIDRVWMATQLHQWCVSIVLERLKDQEEEEEAVVEEGAKLNQAL